MRHHPITPSRLPLLLGGILAGITLLACGGGDSDEDAIFFEHDKAPATVRAAMPQPADLPGGGWRITAEDDFGDESGSGESPFEALMKTEPACRNLSDLSALSQLGGIFGGGDPEEGDPYVARAQVELEQSNPAVPVAPRLEVELEVMPTVEETTSSWTIFKSLMEADSTKACIAAMVNTMFDEQMAQSGLELKFEPVATSARPPRDSVGMSFAMTISMPQVISVDVMMHMYFWSYGNGKVSVMMMGPEEDMTTAFVTEILEAVDAKIVAAEANQ